MRPPTTPAAPDTAPGPAAGPGLAEGPAPAGALPDPPPHPRSHPPSGRPGRTTPALARDVRTRFRARGAPRALAADLYHHLMRVSFLQLMLLLTTGWVGTNIVFMGLYLAGGDCYSAQPDHPVLSAFSFSVQTLSSIGYGAQHPTTPWGHLIADIEAFVGMIFSAMGAGLMFARFSRPSARVGFSDSLVLHRRGGRPHLVLRAANLRGNQIVEASASLYALCDEQTAEGHHARRLIELTLVRGRSPIFALSWLMMHEVDERSPLWGLSEAELRARVDSFVVSLTGIDDTFSQTVHAQRFYSVDELRWDEAFVDMVEPQPDGSQLLHHDKLHLRHPVAPGDQMERLLPIPARGG